MPIVRDKDLVRVQMGTRCKRAQVHLNNLMTVVLKFYDGPWAEPDPFHSHPHEQISYVASGEIVFSCEGEPDQHLGAGDIFYAPSGKKHRIKLVSEEATVIDNFSPIREEFLNS